MTWITSLVIVESMHNFLHFKLMRFFFIIVLCHDLLCNTENGKTNAKCVRAVLKLMELSCVNGLN